MFIFINFLLWLVVFTFTLTISIVHKYFFHFQPILILRLLYYSKKTNTEKIVGNIHLKLNALIKILFIFSKIIYIEVLDNSTCLYNTAIPNGMMKLKFRLESKLDFKVITVRIILHI